MSMHAHAPQTWAPPGWPSAGRARAHPRAGLGMHGGLLLTLGCLPDAACLGTYCRHPFVCGCWHPAWHPLPCCQQRAHSWRHLHRRLRHRRHAHQMPFPRRGPLSQCLHAPGSAAGAPPSPRGSGTQGGMVGAESGVGGRDWMCGVVENALLPFGVKSASKGLRGLMQWWAQPSAVSGLPLHRLSFK